MTVLNESQPTIPDQHILAAQNHAARKAMHLSGIDYDGKLPDGTIDPPIKAALRNLGAMSTKGLGILINAGISIDS